MARMREMVGMGSLSTHSSHRLVDATLTELCRAGQVSLPDDRRLRQAFTVAARRHRIAPLVHTRLRDTCPDVSDVLRPDRDAAVSGFLQSAQTLAQLRSLLGDAPWAVFKGPVLSAYAHPVPGIRTFGDLDIIVQPAHLRAAVDRLLAANWVLLDSTDFLRNPATPGEMHWLSPNAQIVDLHWSPINMRKTRRCFPHMTEHVLADRTVVDVGPATVPTFSPSDTLVHVCLHAALSGANRLQFILDADQLARRDVDWEAVAARAHQWGAVSAVAIVLGRARTLLSTPLPPNLDRLLGTPIAVRTLSAVTTRFSMEAMLRKDASLGRLVARAARPTGRQTVTEIAHRAARGIADRLRRKGAAAPRTDYEPTDDQALESYLRAVERNADP